MGNETQPLTCVECGAEADVLAHGWQAFIGGDSETDDLEVAIYCPDCAEREFGA